MENRLTFYVAEEAKGKSVYQFLKDQGLSSTLIKHLKQDQSICVEGIPVNVNRKVNGGEKVELLLPSEDADGLDPEPLHFEVLFEDDDLLVINKPANLAIHPTFNHKSGTLANAVVYYWQERGVSYRFRPVNRLDKDTSGVVIVALNAYAHHQLSKQQGTEAFRKGYLALVHGRIEQEQGEINLPIGRKESSIIEREVREDGQHALTRFRVAQRFNDATLVNVELLTGRTHQIRVHFAHIGHPLAGDDLYGGDRRLIGRQALHAEWVRFKHPRTKEEITLLAPLPSDFKQLLLSLKTD